jgi:hypothetical protein
MRAKGWMMACLAVVGCGDEGEPDPNDQAQVGGSEAAITFAKDVAPIVRVAEARPGVFIPPFRQCTSPRDGQPGKGPDGKVCANVPSPARPSPAAGSQTTHRATSCRASGLTGLRRLPDGRPPTTPA